MGQCLLKQIYSLASMVSAILSLMDEEVQVFMHHQLSPTIPYQYEFAQALHPLDNHH